MYMCTRCGHVFREGEAAIVVEKHGMERGPYEEISVCPECGGDYTGDIDRCKICGEWFEYDDLYNYLCPECLRAKMTVENGKQFLMDEDTFVQFVFQQLCGAAVGFCHAICDGNDGLFEMAEDYFEKRVEADGASAVKDALIEWVFNQDHYWGYDLFSEWLIRNNIV